MLQFTYRSGSEEEIVHFAKVVYFRKLHTPAKTLIFVYIN